MRLRTVDLDWKVLKNSISWLIGFFRSYKYIAEIVRRHEIRVVNLHYPDSDVLIWLLLRHILPGRALQILVSFHGVDAAKILEANPVKRYLWRKILSATDGVTSCSRFITESLVSKLRLDCDHVHTLDNGINLSALQKESTQPSQICIPSEFVISLATLEQKKGHDILIRAFDAIASKYPKLHLVIAGRKASKTDLEHIHSERSLARAKDRIVIFQDLPHADAMYALRGSLALILASRKEPFGIVVLEAIALRKPVIATNRCGVLERLKSPAIQVVDPDDVQQLSQAIATLIENIEQFKQDALLASTTIGQKFSWSHIADQYMALAASTTR